MTEYQSVRSFDHAFLCHSPGFTPRTADALISVLGDYIAFEPRPNGLIAGVQARLGNLRQCPHAAVAEVASALLGHRDPRVTEEHYNLAMSISAGEEYASITQLYRQQRQHPRQFLAKVREYLAGSAM